LASSVGGGRPAAGEGDQAPRSGQALGFMVATAGYLSVTTNESLLAPVVPVVRGELGISVGTTGLALGLLSLAIASGNLVGGLLLARWGAKRGIVAGVAISAAGALATALSHGRLEFLLAQVLVGLGSGIFFAPVSRRSGCSAAPAGGAWPWASSGSPSRAAWRWRPCSPRLPTPGAGAWPTG
jgi:MFS family permease